MDHIKGSNMLAGCLAFCLFATPTTHADEKSADNKPLTKTTTEKAETSKQETTLRDKRFAEMASKHKERYVALFHKLDMNDDKKLSFDEFLSRFGSVKTIADKPLYEREKSEQNRLVYLEKRFRSVFDGNGNGTVDFNEFMTLYFKPLRHPDVVAAEKAEAAAQRRADKAKRDQSAAQREAAKIERERKAAIKAKSKDKDAREKTIDRPKADRDRDE